MAQGNDRYHPPNNLLILFPGIFVSILHLFAIQDFPDDHRQIWFVDPLAKPEEIGTYLRFHNERVTGVLSLGLPFLVNGSDVPGFIQNCHTYRKQSKERLVQIALIIRFLQQSFWAAALSMSLRKMGGVTDWVETYE